MYDALREVLTINDLVLWDQNIKPENQWNIYNAQSLWDKITSIKECHCDEEMMKKLSEIVARMEYYDVANLDRRPALRFYGDLWLNGSLRSYNAAAETVYKYRPPDKDIELLNVEGVPPSSRRRVKN